LQLARARQEFGIGDDVPLGGIQAFEEVLADPDYVPTAFIHKRAPRKSAKADPVRRGQQQREEQKRFHLPGENKHTQLRWDVRAKLRENVVSLALSGTPSVRSVSGVVLSPMRVLSVAALDDWRLVFGAG
jgi:hypothetical protein